MSFELSVRWATFARDSNQNTNKHIMATNITLTMIKPDAVAAGHSGKIIDLIIQSGFKVQAMKLSRLSKEKAEEFYSVHKERGFFGDLIKFMTEGPVIAAILEKENAVEDFRKLIGATNPANAADGTIRKLFATDIERNAVHGSDSDENAAIEASFHFSGLERY
ncbi:MAG: nucleoside-diphosphate kinase [Bacteroidetes bacterium]|nr:nucleoside-diphosphate kinase [Bacteroidota bacterium]